MTALTGVAPRAEPVRAARRRRPRAGRWRTPAWLAAAGAATVLALGTQAGSVPAAVHSVAGADRRWLLLAAAAGSASYVAAAVAQLGGLDRSTRAAGPGGPPGWWGRLVVVQLACACTNRLLPAGAGAMATNVRYLTRRGLTVGQAGAAVATSAAAGVVMHLLTLLAALPVLLALPAVHDLVLQHLPGRPAALWATGGALAAAGLLAQPLPALRGPVEAARTTLRHLASAVRDSRRAAALLGGSMGVTLAHAVAFIAALRAVGSPTPVLVALAVYVAAVAVAGCVPTPGGAGGVDVALLAALAATGAPAASSAAAVLAFRLVTFWLPVLPGAGALLWLLHRRWL